MTKVIRSSSYELQEVYYEMGIRDELPKSWDEFKLFVINFWIGESLNDKRKFSDENWSSYVVRLYEWVISHGYSDASIFDKIRKEKLPIQLQMVIYIPEISINSIICSIKQFEKNYMNRKEKQQ
jgi:hypothetical protein